MNCEVFESTEENHLASLHRVVLEKKAESKLLHL